MANENDALNKEVDRLKHLNELHSNATRPAEHSSFSQPAQATGGYPSNPQRSVAICWTCGEPGHFARDHRQGQQEYRQPRASGYPGTQTQSAMTTSHRVVGATTGPEGKKRRRNLPSCYH